MLSGDISRAEHAYRQTAAKGTTDGTHWYNIATFEDRNQNPLAALAATEKALFYGFDGTPVWYLREKNYRLIGNLCEARRCLLARQKRAPQDRSLRRELRRLKRQIASQMKKSGSLERVTCANCHRDARLVITPIGYELICHCPSPTLDADSLVKTREVLAAEGLDTPPYRPQGTTS